ncbi:MAG: site-2 protease family protein [Leptospirales bacterium]
MSITRQDIPLGKILGISIGLDYSWFVIFILITWTLAVGYYPATYPGWGSLQYWFIGGITAVLFFSCILLHEIGHSIVAIWYKIPVRSITLFVFGGVAQIESDPPSAVAEFFVAIAGPVTSLALGLIFYGMGTLFPVSGPLSGLFKYLSYINLVLAVFNLIPGYPLDGGRVFRAIVWSITHNFRKSTLIAAHVGQFFGFSLIFIGVWKVFHGDFGGGLWISFIGWFLSNAASSQIQQVNFQGWLGEHKVSQAMTRQCASVPEGESLKDLVEEQIMSKGERCFLVNRESVPVGLVTLHQIKEVSQSDWGTKSAGQVMIPIEMLKRVQSGDSLWSALKKMNRDGVNQLPVMDDGKVIGVLSREDVITFLGTLQELSVP